MDRTERFYRIDQMIQDRTVVPIQSFLDELDISRTTFKRDLEYMKNRLNAPIEYDRTTMGTATRNMWRPAHGFSCQTYGSTPLRFTHYSSCSS